MQKLNRNCFTDEFHSAILSAALETSRASMCLLSYLSRRRRKCENDEEREANLQKCATECFTDSVMLDRPKASFMSDRETTESPVVTNGAIEEG